MSKETSHGACHKCSKKLKEGSYIQCDICGCRFHKTDCGLRYEKASCSTPLDQCPRCSSSCICSGGVVICHAGKLKRKRHQAQLQKEERRRPVLVHNSSWSWKHRLQAPRDNPAEGGSPPAAAADATAAAAATGTATASATVSSHLQPSSSGGSHDASQERECASREASGLSHGATWKAREAETTLSSRRRSPLRPNSAAIDVPQLQAKSAPTTSADSGQHSSETQQAGATFSPSSGDMGSSGAQQPDMKTCSNGIAGYSREAYALDSLASAAAMDLQGNLDSQSRPQKLAQPSAACIHWERVRSAIPSRNALPTLQHYNPAYAHMDPSEEMGLPLKSFSTTKSAGDSGTVASCNPSYHGARPDLANNHMLQGDAEIVKTLMHDYLKSEERNHGMCVDLPVNKQLKILHAANTEQDLKNEVYYSGPTAYYTPHAMSGNLGVETAMPSSLQTSNEGNFLENMTTNIMTINQEAALNVVSHNLFKGQEGGPTDYIAPVEAEMDPFMYLLDGNEGQHGQAPFEPHDNTPSDVKDLDRMLDIENIPISVEDSEISAELPLSYKYEEDMLPSMQNQEYRQDNPLSNCRASDSNRTVDSKHTLTSPSYTTVSMTDIDKQTEQDIDDTTPLRKRDEKWELMRTMLKPSSYPHPNFCATTFLLALCGLGVIIGLSLICFGDCSSDNDSGTIVVLDQPSGKNINQDRLPASGTIQFTPVDFPSQGREDDVDAAVGSKERYMWPMLVMIVLGVLCFLSLMYCGREMYILLQCRWRRKQRRANLKALSKVQHGQYDPKGKEVALDVHETSSKEIEIQEIRENLEEGECIASLEAVQSNRENPSSENTIARESHGTGEPRITVENCGENSHAQDDGDNTSATGNTHESEATSSSDSVK